MIDIEAVVTRLTTTLLRVNVDVDLRVPAAYLADVNALIAEAYRLDALVTRHHAFGIMDGISPGDYCPVCEPSKSFRK